jgi:hypothetical protein
MNNLFEYKSFKKALHKSSAILRNKVSCRSIST